ncbi:LysR family transcriptional regulator [Pseudoduganella sp. FT55W]|uniref:LysR family transcriptional regulator n=1 Tax=Duganella rivi TaxID=2666083 RepID=A0A7X4GU27_9BURK|nr:LysR family transcriptional regulator [Duganella rivi]MYM68639.1 LysR family transcriptional regulator [Duganella rivi]
MDSRSGEMLVFVKVVETGSFSAAAQLLNLSPSAISKVVTRMEERLGVLLFQRSTRQMSLTAEGREFHDSCVRILDDIDEAEQGVSQRSASIRGLLRVNVSLPFGTHYVVPLLPEFAQRYPEIAVDISLSDTRIDLQRESVDVAIRMGPLNDGSFRARSLGRSRRVVVAAPSYLQRHGTPVVPDDLVRHHCLNFNFRRSLDEWPFIINGHTTQLTVSGGIMTNNGETMRQLTLDGLGVSRLGMFHVYEDIKAGRLVELLANYNAGDVEDINIIFSSQRHLPLRVRAFIDFMVEKLRIEFA